MTSLALQEAICESFLRGDCREPKSQPGSRYAHLGGKSSDRVGGYLIERSWHALLFRTTRTFFADLETSGMIVDNESARAQLIERVLKPANAYLDPDTLEIKSAPLEQDPDPLHYVNFLSAFGSSNGQIAFWTQERVKSTFNEDVISTMRNATLSGSGFCRNEAG